MPFRRGATKKELVPLSDEELDLLYRKYTGGEESDTSDTKSKTTLQENVETALNAWKKRLDLLDLLKRNNREDINSVEVREVRVEIKVQDTLIFNALLGNPEAFCQWIKTIIAKGKFEARQAYGYSIHLAKNLDFAKEAKLTEKEIIKKRGPFLIYKGRRYIPCSNPCDEDQRKVFYYLNALRRQSA